MRVLKEVRRFFTTETIHRIEDNLQPNSSKEGLRGTSDFVTQKADPHPCFYIPIPAAFTIVTTRGSAPWTVVNAQSR